MPKKKRKTLVTSAPATDIDGKPSAMVDIGMTVNEEDLVSTGQERDPELYERMTVSGTTFWSPTNQRAEQLRALYTKHVKSLGEDGHWKDECEAIVSGPKLVADVREAMDFHGSLVDQEDELPSGRVRLYSEGYWAHGF